MVKDFNEIMENMVNPLENPDFYALLMTDNRYYGYTEDHGAFSICHNYDLGSTTFETYHKLLSVALKEYLSNMYSYEEYRKKYPNSSEKGFLTMKKVFTNLINSPDKLPSFLKRNHRNIEQILGLMTQTDENGNLYRVGWMYFKSHHLNPNNEHHPIKSNNVRHRLYLTVDTEKRAEITKKIIEECNKRQLPYNFKVHINFNKRKENQQSDTIVIYLENEEQVVQYTNLINEIIENNSELKSHIHKPSPHLGIINDYIGYGFEPKLNSGKTSYSKLLKQSIPISLVSNMSKNILQFLSNHDLRRIYDAWIPEGYRLAKPSEWGMLKLENSENCLNLKNKGKKERTIEDIERLKKIYGNYFRRENMKLDEIEKIKRQIIYQLIKLYPDMQKNNMFGIDVEEIKYEMQWEEPDEFEH